MKIKLSILLLSLAVLAPLNSIGSIPNGQFSCNKKSIQNSLLGTWERDISEVFISATYSDSGEYFGHIKYKAVGRIIEFSSSWSLDGNKITYVYNYFRENGSIQPNSDGIKDADYIVQLTCHSMVLETMDGKKAYYNKKDT